MTDTASVAKAFTKLLQEGRDGEAQDRYWADDIVSLEPQQGEHAVARGRAALAAKHAWWESQVEAVHALETSGPYVHGDQFAVRFTLDVTMKSAGRIAMDEIGLYTVKNGEIVEERFFFVSAEI